VLFEPAKQLESSHALATISQSGSSLTFVPPKAGVSTDLENPEVERRRHAVLIATVKDFITTAEPVGSHQLAKRYTLGVRAATIRSLMAELENEGFLSQPHTSAGRMPTEKAFRYYVDHLAHSSRIGFDERAQIEFQYSGGPRDLNHTMRETSRMLALLSGLAALVMAPRLEAVILESVNFVRLRTRQVLAIFVAATGGAQTRIVDLDRDFAQDALDRMARYLNEWICGRTLESARASIERALHDDRAHYDSFTTEALQLGDAITVGAPSVEIFVEGSAQALDQPEFADPVKLKELLRALEDKTSLLQLLERSIAAHGPMVCIGSENSDSNMADLSVVASAYAAGSTPLGSVAVVGPLRMDYSRVIPIVDYTARALSRILEP
jgi:heat-inducible transcriptional repressor